MLGSPPAPGITFGKDMKVRIHERYTVWWDDDDSFIDLVDNDNMTLCWYDWKYGRFGGMLLAEVDVKEGSLPRKVLNTFKLFCLRNKLTLSR